ncbi:hypothetical protein ACFFJN_07410 [Erwinia mallotivora]|uniref:hypothetical protein n=1 Tax=Erwinia mallotivora TaxID=69222 RepID=UPI0035E57E51
MSINSLSCIIILSFFLTASFLIMPYLVSVIAPTAGLNVTEITWGLGICNAVAALTLYFRPAFPDASRLLILIMLFIFTGTVSVLAGMSFGISLILLLGIGMMRISLVNFSDFNRQVHMQTNTEDGIKRALSAANVVSNIISCSVPIAAAVILHKWGAAGLARISILLSLCSFLLASCLFKGNKSLRNVTVSSKPSPGRTINRFASHAPLYLLVMINSVIFAFIFSYIPLKITQVPQDMLAAAQQYIALYFTINSVVVVVLSFPVLYFLGKIKLSDRNVTLVATVLSLVSIIPFTVYNGEPEIITLSAVLMGLSEIIFLPFIVSYVSSKYLEEKEMILRDITLLGVSLSAAVSSPVAGLMYHYGNKGLSLFILICLIIFIFCVTKMEECRNEK